MNKLKENIDNLKLQISKGKFPHTHKLYAGLGLIITDKKDYRASDRDIVICTTHAGALSWLVFQMRHIFHRNMSYSSQFEFYARIGGIIKTNLKSDGDLIDVMLLIVDEMYFHFPDRVVYKIVPF
jgi:hypothetical protein